MDEQAEPSRKGERDEARHVRRIRLTGRGVGIAFGAVLATAVTLLVGSAVAVELLVDAEFLGGVLNEALGPATEGRYRLDLDEVEVSAWSGDLAVTGIRLRPAEGFRGAEARAGGPALRFSGDVARVSIEGVRLWRLIRDHDLEATAFRVQAPRMGVIVPPRETPSEGAPVQVDPAPSPPDDQPSPDTAATTGDTRHATVARQLPHIHVGQVAFEDVQVTLVTLRRDDTARREAPLTDRLRGLTVTFDDLRIDPNEETSADRFLFSRDLRLEIEALDLTTSGGGRFEVGPLSASSAGGELRLDRLALVPPWTRTEFLAGAGTGRDHVTLTVGPVTVTGMEWWRLLENLDAAADTVRIQDLSVEVLSDKHRPSDPRPGPPTMPHDVIRELAVGLSVDVVELENGSVTYSERGPESDRPGTVAFSAIDGQITNVTNDAERVSREGPTRLDLQARVFDAAPMTVRASLPLLDPPPTMVFFARIGAFEAGAVNSILPDLEGIRVTDGHVDSARVDIRYGPGGASGTVMVGYSDLSIRKEDRNTGDQNVGQKLTSFLANTFVIRGSNQPDDDRGPREGVVEYEAPRDAPFFKIFWQAVRAGLIDVAKR